MCLSRAAFFAGCIALFSVSATTFADDNADPKQTGSAGEGERRRRGRRVFFRPTTVIVIGEGESVRDVISRTRERLAWKLPERDPAARSGIADHIQNRLAALRDKLHAARKGLSADRAAGDNLGPRAQSPSVEARRERAGEARRERGAEARERVAGDRLARPPPHERR